MTVLETLRALLLDFLETPLETGVPRRLRIDTVPGKATVCMGVRRCGKSTYLFQQIEHLLAEGVPKENILYLNLFDDRLHPLRHEGLGRVTEAYYSLYPEKKGTETVYCFFDEIQAVEGWEAFVDRILRTERCEVYLTGSSARMLSKEIATQMRGRALSWELFPFSFREFLDFKGIDASGPLSTRRRLQVRKAFEEYWETGGFPEVLGLDRRLRVKIHQEYVQSILFRDLVERHDLVSASVRRDTMTLLLHTGEFLPEDPGTVPALQTGPTGGFQSPPLRLQRSAGPRPIFPSFTSLIYASAMTTSFVPAIYPQTLLDLLPTTSTISPS